jgi:hypothetical protein
LVRGCCDRIDSSGQTAATFSYVVTSPPAIAFIGALLLLLH